MGLTDGTGLSAADVAAVTGNNGGFGGFNGDGAWWLLVLFLFAFGGNGWGGANSGAGPVNIVESGMQRGFDQQAVMTGLNGISGALSDAAVARANQTASILQGFSGVQSQIANTGFNLTNTMMQNEMARQQCCCDTKQAIADLKYTIATENCADRAAISDGIRDVIANQNSLAQNIKDMLCQQEIEALKTQNSNLQTQLNMYTLAASQNAQTAQLIQDNNAQTTALINRIAPYPVPSYTVPNPYATPTTTT